MEKYILNILFLLLVGTNAAAQDLVMYGEITESVFAEDSPIPTFGEGTPCAVVDIYMDDLDDIFFQSSLIIDDPERKRGKYRLYTYVPDGTEVPEILIIKENYMPYHLVFQPGQLKSKMLYKVVLLFQNAQTVEELYRNGMELFNQKDYKHAIPWLERAAAKYHVKAQNKLGEIYAYYNDDKDYDKAVKYFTMAAESMYPNAYNSLAYCAAKGQGMEQSFDKAHYYLDQAIKLDNHWNYYDSKGEIYLMEGDVTQAKLYYDKCIELNAYYYKYETELWKYFNE